MRRVFIRSAAFARPQLLVSQAEAASRIGALAGRKSRVESIAKATRIESRAVAFPVDQIGRLSTIQERNTLYQQVAPGLATEAAGQLLAGRSPSAIDCLVTASCTGYMVPGLDVSLAQVLELRADTARLPITEAGCAGGVVALARASDYLTAHHSARQALVAAVELCSLAFQASDDVSNLVSTLIFGDGAAAVLLEAGGEGDSGLEVLDSASMLVPNTTEAIGFDLTDHGFAPRLALDIAELLPGAVAESVQCLLVKNGMALDDVAFWLAHPGGPKILEASQEALQLCEDDLRWSWQSLSELGNMSSVAILDVLRRYLDDSLAPKGPGIVLAFGPGISLELLLVNRC